MRPNSPTPLYPLPFTDLCLWLACAAMFGLALLGLIGG